MLHNWSYREVTNFLKKNGFTFHKEIGGSHQAWIKHGSNNKADRTVVVNFSHTSYPVRTLKTMIRQLGIEEKIWMKQ